MSKRGHLNFKIQSSEFSIVAYHFPVSMQSKLLLLYIIWWGRNDCGMHLSKPPFKMLLACLNVGSIKTLTIKWMFLQHQRAQMMIQHFVMSIFRSHSILAQLSQMWSWLRKKGRTAAVAHFWPQNNNEKRGFTASQEIGQTTFVLKKRQYKEIERLL